MKKIWYAPNKKEAYGDAEINAVIECLHEGWLAGFGPKTIHYTGDPKYDANTIKVLNAYIPLVKTMSDLLTQSFDTALTTANFAAKTFGISAKSTDTQPSPETLLPNTVQQNRAWDYRSRLITGLVDVLDYNYKHPQNPITWAAIQNGDGKTIPTQIGILDQPVNKATIGELIHYRYPKWDNTLSSSVAQAKKTEADRFIGEVTAINPSLGDTYRQIDDYAVKVNDALGKDNLSTDKLVTITTAFRELTMQLALKDNNFYKFYKTHYERLFGPLEGFNK
jgi:hypothetical protein